MKTQDYWEKRYKSGGNSGAGSYSIECDFKVEFINSIIEKKNIQTINDFGCGDGNVISQIKGFNQYVGYDISSTAVNKCDLKLGSNPKYKFINSISEFIPSDLSTSIDVIYHILEEELFTEYLQSLYDYSTKYILVYGVDQNSEYSGNHVKYRKFSDILTFKYNLDLILTEHYKPKHGTSGPVAFYLFEKV